MLDNDQLTKNAILIYQDFMKDVSEDKIKNDGTCRFLSLVDKYLLQDKKSRIQLDTGKYIYRARLINDDQIREELGLKIANGKTFGYDESNSREAPLGKAEVGRNNITGMSYFYAADRIETACAEVKPAMSQFVSVATFQIKKPIEIIDLYSGFSFDKKDLQKEEVSLGLIFTYVMMHFFISAFSTKEYKASQALAEYIRKYGVDGLAYRSLHDYKGMNYTIFNCHRDRVKYISSKILMLQKQDLIFTDFDREKTIKVESMGSNRFDIIESKTVLDTLAAKLQYPPEKQNENN